MMVKSTKSMIDVKTREEFSRWSRRFALDYLTTAALQTLNDKLWIDLEWERWANRASLSRVMSCDSKTELDWHESRSHEKVAVYVTNSHSEGGDSCTPLKIQMLTINLWTLLVRIEAYLPFFSLFHSDLHEKVDLKCQKDPNSGDTQENHTA